MAKFFWVAVVGVISGAAGAVAIQVAFVMLDAPGSSSHIPTTDEWALVVANDVCARWEHSPKNIQHVSVRAYSERGGITFGTKSTYRHAAFAKLASTQCQGDLRNEFRKHGWDTPPLSTKFHFLSDD